MIENVVYNKDRHHLEIGEGGGTQGSDGRSAYQLAVDNGFVGTINQWLASLMGKSGKDGKDGVDGKNGTDGRNFQVDGVKDKISNLPPASEHNGEWWVTYELGHIHYSQDGEWKDVARFVGVEGKQGEKGEQGEKGDGIPSGGEPNDMLTILPNNEVGWRAPKVGAKSGNISLTTNGEKKRIELGMPFDLEFNRLTSIYSRISIVFNKDVDNLIYNYKLHRNGLIRGVNTSGSFKKDTSNQIEGDFYIEGRDYGIINVYYNNKWTKIELFGTIEGVVWSLNNIN